MQLNRDTNPGRAVHVGDSFLRPAEIAFDTTEAPEHLFNRRWNKRPGTMPENPFGGTDLVKLNPPAGSPNLVEHPETTTVPVQVLRIGEVCLGTMPCEVFCEIGLDFKRRSPLQPAFLVSLSHGYFGYLPTSRQHELGGYETWIGTNRLERTASDKLWHPTGTPSFVDKNL